MISVESGNGVEMNWRMRESGILGRSVIFPESWRSFWGGIGEVSDKSGIGRSGKTCTDRPEILTREAKFNYI